MVSRKTSEKYGGGPGAAEQLPGSERSTRPLLTFNVKWGRQALCRVGEAGSSTPVMQGSGEGGIV